MPQTWTFEIRNTVPDYPSADDTAEVEEVYHHINAMCFLLASIPYATVYGEARAFARELLNTLRIVDPSKSNQPFDANLLQVMNHELQNVVAHGSSDRVLMRTLYEAVAQPGTPEHDIVGYYQAIQAADTNSRLCIPFLHVQDGTKKPICSVAMDDHITRIGNYTLFDIYTKSKRYFPELDRAVCHGRYIGALGHGDGLMALSSYGDDVRAFTGPGINNRTCSGNGCVTNAGTWCNVDSAGNCTTGSM